MALRAVPGRLIIMETTFGSRLRHLRRKIKLTQKELGEELGLKQSTIAYYESEKREPNSKTLQRLADYFQVEVPYLLGVFDEPDSRSDTNPDPILTEDVVFLSFGDTSYDKRRLIQQIFNIVNKLNIDGLQHAETYLAFLTTLDKYKRK